MISPKVINVAKKRILLAGGSGFIGSHVRVGLLRRGVPEAQIIIPKSQGCDLRVWDRCVDIMRGVDVVIDCAAVPGDIQLRAQIPGKLFYENLIIGTHLMEAAFREGVEKIITIGSATEYPESAGAPLKEEHLWDGLPSGGNIPYGLSKRVVALQGELYRRQSGFHAIHILLTNTYGPGERYESGYMIPSLMQKFLGAVERKDAKVEVWGTGNAVRDVIFVEDAVEGIISAIERYDEAMPLNIGSGAGISIKELVVLLCSFTGFSGEVAWDTSKPEGDPKRLLDVTRAEQYIGFHALTSLEDGLRATIEWHKAHPTKT